MFITLSSVCMCLFSTLRIYCRLKGFMGSSLAVRGQTGCLVRGVRLVDLGCLSGSHTGNGIREWVREERLHVCHVHSRRKRRLTWSVGATMRAGTCRERRVKEGGTLYQWRRLNIRQPTRAVAVQLLPSRDNCLSFCDHFIKICL